MKKIICCAISMLIMNSTAFSGAHSLTHTSRANCSNNESISWESGVDHWLSVRSFHFPKSEARWCYVSTPYCNLAKKGDCLPGDRYRTEEELRHFVKTWRSAAVHWLEAPIVSPEWEKVDGSHYIYDVVIRESKYITTEATDCNIYNGWWD